MNWLLACLLLLLPTQVWGGTVARAVAAPAITTDLYDTFIVWGDTQSSSNDPFTGPPCTAQSRCNDQQVQAQWVCDRKEDENIRAVLGVGDIVFAPLNLDQWDNTREFIDILDACDVPYVPTFGNHEAEDGGTFLGTPETLSDGTNYWNYYGVAADSKPWMAQRGQYTEISGAQSCCSPPGTLLYSETNNTGARSFWGRFGSRFAVMAAEWELGSRIQQIAGSCGDTALTWGWAQSVMAANPRLVFIHITHTGPCEMTSFVGSGCAQWTDSVSGGACDATRQWKTYRDNADNALVFLHGHRNEAGGDCTVNGGGFHKNIVRDSGTNAFLGGYDFTCNTRAYAADDGYGWSARMRWFRHRGEYCLQNIRTVNATTGVNGVQTAYPLAAPDIDRTTNSNNVEVCVPIVLPLALR